MWHDGPRDIAPIGRSKLFMPDRGICMTPSIRAAGPSYMKPTPAPVQRPSNPPQPDDAPPMVITHTIANRQLITAASPAAVAFGVRVGLTLTEANALCPNLLHFDEAPTKDARALDALARWMMRYSPIVALSPQSSVLSTIFLDLTGCDRALGSIESIVTNVITSLSRLRLSASVAVAPTPGAAWALASFPKQLPIENCQLSIENLPTALAPLPIDSLRLEEEITASLHHLGLETIGQLLNLPRAMLPARFGATLLLRLDQALGRIDEPLVPLIYHAPLEARMDFDGPVNSIETIHLVFKRLVTELVAELARRGAGAREMQIEFFRPYAQTIAQTIRLSRPSRDPKNLFNLIRCATENLDGSDCCEMGGDGFLGIRLAIPRFERITDQQIALLDHERHTNAIELTQLIERLCVRLGDDAITQPTLTESYIPECSWTEKSPDQTPACERSEHPDFWTRPLHLLTEPIEIGVMVSPSEDRNGRPILFRHNNKVHELTHTIGPERIAGEWWRGHDRTRDYFDVEDADGNRFWLFRVQETNRWYLHGVFA